MYQELGQELLSIQYLKDYSQGQTDAAAWPTLIKCGDRYTAIKKYEMSLACYEEALTLDPNAPVKKKISNLNALMR
jgi:tetratricopeptide (TPR) repeat protein